MVVKYRILETVKKSNRIIGYNCESSNGQVGFITKDKVIKLIQNNKVENARLRVYKGRYIIVIKPIKTSVITKQNIQNRTTKSNAERARDFQNKCELILGKQLFELDIQSDDKVVLLRVNNVEQMYNKLVIPDFITDYEYTGVKHKYQGVSPFEGTLYTSVRVDANFKEYVMLFANMVTTELEVTFNNKIKQEELNCEGMFCGCSYMRKLKLINFDTSNVYNMAEMFSYCGSLVSVNTDCFDTGNVETMYAMFKGCSVIPYIDVSNWNTSKVVDMSSMFAKCIQLIKLDLKNFDTGNVLTMSGMFAECTSLKELNVSSFNTSKVKDMSVMFSTLIKITALDLRSFDTSNVETMYGMFYSCTNLISLDIRNFRTRKVFDMEFMFDKCFVLKHLNVSNFDTRNVRKMKGMFRYNTSIGHEEPLDLSSFTFDKRADTSEMLYMYNDNTNNGVKTKVIINPLADTELIGHDNNVEFIQAK